MSQGCAFIALDHKDIYLNGDRTAVILEMEYRADILVKAEPLATGLAKDVHGQVDFYHSALQYNKFILKLFIQTQVFLDVNLIENNPFNFLWSCHRHLIGFPVHCNISL